MLQEDTLGIQVRDLKGNLNLHQNIKHITHTEIDALWCLLQRLCVNCGVSFKDPPPSQNAQKEKTSFRGEKNLPAKESKDILVRIANVRGQHVPDCTSKQTITEASTQCNKKITNR